MSHCHKTHYSKHQEVSTLLPWYVNKTLHSSENTLVETHLKSCLICRIELTNLQKLSASICQENPLATVAHTSFLQLKKRIHKTHKSTKQKIGLFDVLSGYRQWFTSYNLKHLVSQHPGFALTTVLLFTFSLFIPNYLGTKQISGNVYHTLSSTKSIAYMENEIRVVFSSDITQEQIDNILASVQGKILAGPTPHGVFRVIIGTQKMTSTDIKKIVTLLRKKTHVIFAEPTFTLLSPTSSKSSG